MPCRGAPAPCFPGGGSELHLQLLPKLPLASLCFPPSPFTTLTPHLRKPLPATHLLFEHRIVKHLTSKPLVFFSNLFSRGFLPLCSSAFHASLQVLALRCSTDHIFSHLRSDRFTSLLTLVSLLSASSTSVTPCSLHYLRSSLQKRLRTRLTSHSRSSVTRATGHPGRFPLFSLSLPLLPLFLPSLPSLPPSPLPLPSPLSSARRALSLCRFSSRFYLFCPLLRSFCSRL